MGESIWHTNGIMGMMSKETSKLIGEQIAQIPLELGNVNQCHVKSMMELDLGMAMISSRSIMYMILSCP
jgi:hypothetical protein